MSMAEALLIEPHYFPCILCFQRMYGASALFLAVDGTYQKQTFQTRCYILTFEGMQKLVVPVQHASRHGIYRDVKIDYTKHWVSQHIHALASAYGQTPYYPFLADIIYPILQKKPIFLLDLTLPLLRGLFDFLQISKEIRLYDEAKSSPSVRCEDVRGFFSPKSKVLQNIVVPNYPQDFTPTRSPLLSVLDLLFSQGPYAQELLH